MREPAFWRDGGLAAWLLAPAAALYAAVADARLARPGTRVSVPVLCVGNFTAGGAGKTPTAIALAGMAMARGFRPHFLTRGHGGRARGPLALQPGHTAREVGDEALLLGRTAPTVIARDRAAGAALAIRNGADLIVMDDGFQNPSLHKDVSLIVIDGMYGIGNGRTIPAGPLRASLEAQLRKADAILIAGPLSPAAQDTVSQARARGIPILTGSLRPDPAAIDNLRGHALLAFAGIGRPDKFFATLHAAGLDVRETRAFADHHPFTAAQARALLDTAARGNLTLVTTEKDIARMRGDPALAPLAERARTLPVTMTFDDEAAVQREVIGKLTAGMPAAISPGRDGSA